MKFRKLLAKFNELAGGTESNQSIDVEKLEELTALLQKKRQRYEQRLQGDLDPDKRKSYVIRLKVIDAQLEKSRELTTGVSQSVSTNNNA